MRGLAASGSGSTDFKALYDLLSSLSVVPQSLPLRLATFLKLMFKGTPFSTARELFPIYYLRANPNHKSSALLLERTIRLNPKRAIDFL